ncbi:MAG: glycerophosphodiester phosphodiesterase [Deltaproteobacteria bacterium]
MKPASEYAALSGSRPLTFAHRGGAGLWPENTLGAFQAAIELGCSHLETDLRLTRDGQIVLFHDSSLERTTDGEGDVSSYTLEQLRRLDAGYRFSPSGQGFPARGTGAKIPTLGELCALAPRICFNVELKERGSPDLPEALWQFIQQYDLADRIVVAAEQHALLRSFRELSEGRVATSATKRECLEFWLASRLGASSRLAIAYQALQIPVSVNGWRILTPRFLNAAHQLGIAVHVWTIDEAAEMNTVLELGVDGVMSDYPDRLLEVVRTRNSGSR